ncbi:hypothetical protein LSTR_LSTR013176 [Laodelphax striatellus]|uniref:Cubilin n=1 Tax=Laodelphax striatellus TaxID=195883 RepID=A0A482X2E0_LAOST|nr:hypothetical protein LSTR_LSTR013176 [Laodelphax striatellus]
MERWLVLQKVTIILVIFVFNYSSALKDQARLETRNGHLYIIAADSKNITFVTSGSGAVNLNGENLVHLVAVAKKASAVVENIQSSLLVPFEERLNTLTETINGPNGLVQALAQLQNNKGNASESAIGGTSRNYYTKLLRVKIRRLEQNVRYLKRLLTTDECLSNPCQNGGTCTDMYGGYHCHCPEQWEGAQCTVDVNECARFGGTELGCQNGATCINRPGSYQCSCAQGYHGIHCANQDLKCTAANSRELCGHGTCIVPQGGAADPGFICICETGWEKDGYACSKDIDECRTYRGVCSQNPPVRCHNVPGSYYCEQCPPGYSGDGYFCSDIDECAINNGGCSLLPKVSCFNTQGSRTCGPCPPGYMGDGVTCTYAGGACHVNNGGCHPSARCLQLPGISNSFVQCTCPAGYTGSGLGADGCVFTGMAVYDACTPNPCNNGGSCQPTFANRFQCLCPLQFVGTTCETERDPCNPNPCRNGGTCLANKNYVPKSRFEFGTDNYHTCNCLAGFTGNNCQSEMQECGMGPTAVDSGEIRYPISASHTYEGNLHCEWTLYARNDTQVLNISFTKFDLEESTLCKSDYIQIYDGIAPYGQVVGRNRFCGKTAPAPFQSVHNRVTITFHSDKSVSGDGFAFNYTAVKPVCGWNKFVVSNGQLSSPGSPGHYPPNKDCFFVLNTRYTKRLQLNFFSLDIEDSPNCTKDYLRVWDEDDVQLEKYCGKNNIPNPIVSVSSTIKIEFHSDGEGSGSGFQIAYNVLPGTPGCGGTLTGAKGQIISPSKAQSADKPGGTYPENLHCEWLIQVPKGQRIRIYFTKFSLEGRGKCTHDKLQISDGGDSRAKLIGKWCGSQLPPVVETSGNLALVEFVTDNTVGGEGFRLVYEIICGGVFTELEGSFASPMYPSNYMVDHACTYLIEQPPGKVIKLQFLDFDVFGLPTKGNDRCLGDYVRVFDGESSNATKIGEYCGDMRPGLITSTFNYLRIEFLSTKFRTARGFYANYSTIDVACGGILKSRTGIIQSPESANKQGKYPHNMYCVWIIVAPVGFIVQLSWSHFSLEPSMNRCPHDYVQVFDNSSYAMMEDDSFSNTKYCGRVLPPMMTSSDNMVTVIFKSDASVANEGFLANYIMKNASKKFNYFTNYFFKLMDNQQVILIRFFVACGGTYLSAYGVIKSPHHPHPYPGNRQCSWIIQTRNGQQIRLRVHHFQLDRNPHPQCLRDYLEIRNGGSEQSPLIGKYCGTNIPEEILSLSNQLFIKFNSHSLTYGGVFNMTWDGSLTGCGGEIVGVSGSIHSPNYPQPYGNHAECFYSVTVSKGSRVQLTVVDLQLENSKDCRLDYIQVYNGPSEKYPLIGKYCNVHPPNIVSNSNQLFIKFRSDGTVEYRGFHLSYKTVCEGVELTGFRGVIESPNFPAIFEPSVNCTWIIKAPQGNKINITFSHFDMGKELGYLRRVNCTYFGYVEISTKDSKNIEDDSGSETTIGQYCKDNIPAPITTSGNIAIVKLRTKLRNWYQGFRLEWTVHGCGGELLGNLAGKIQSPGFPRPYDHRVTCEWHISVPPGHAIQINVTDFNLEQSYYCHADYLQIFGGPDEESPLQSKLCGNQPVPFLQTSSSNHMFVRFSSDITFNGRGFSANYKAVRQKCGGIFIGTFGKIYSRNYPKHYEKTDDCIWQIKTKENHLLILTFSEFNLFSSTNCSLDSVTVYDGESLTDPVLLTHCGSQPPNPAYIMSTGNILTVRHKSNNSNARTGFSAFYQMACGGNLVATDDRQFLSYEAVHHVILDNDDEMRKNCSWYISADALDKRVTISFSYVDINNHSASANGSCGNSGLFVFDGEDAGQRRPIAELCGPRLPPPITSSGSRMLVRFEEFWRADTNSHFVLSYSSMSTECGGNISADHGVIMSKDYPSLQQPDSECVWYLKGSDGVNVVLDLTVPCASAAADASSVADDTDCGEDYIEVRDGSSGGKLLGLYCCERAPTSTLAARTLWVKFELGASNVSNHNLRFTGNFHLSHLNELTGTSGLISSPFYPKFYPRQGTFEWRITVTYGMIFDGFDETAPSLLKEAGAILPDPVRSTGNVMFIRFATAGFLSLGSRFQLTWVAEDTNNYSSIKEKNEADMKVMGKYCNKPAKSESYIYNTRRMQITFVSDYFVNKTGFSVTTLCYKVCGGELEGPNGEISTWDVDADQRLAHIRVMCEWHVKVRPGRTIQVQFDKLDIPHTAGKPCSTDYVLLKNGETSASPNLGVGKFCGTDIPVLPDTSSNHLYVKYPALIHARGFKLLYREVSLNCGWDIKLAKNNDTQIITTRNYPSTPDPHTECVWRVTAPPGRSIHIDFLDKLTGAHNIDCTREYVELRDGGTETSYLMGGKRYCYNTPSFQITSGNMLWIKFFTDEEATMDGFRIKVSLNLCGGTFYPVQEMGLIESPNYPENYPRNASCQWRLVASDSQTFSISVPQLHLRGYRSMTCDRAPDKLKVIWGVPDLADRTNVVLGDNTTTKETRVICNNNHSPTEVIQSPGNEVFVTFESSADASPVTPVIAGVPLYMSPGFRPRILSNRPRLAQIRDEMTQRLSTNSIDPNTLVFVVELNRTFQECRTVLRQSQGVIQSPNYPNPGVRDFYYCQWRIYVPKGRRVTFKLIDLDLDDNARGTTKIWGLQRLTLSNNPESYSYRIAMLTGSNHTGKVFESTSNMMVVNYAVNRRTVHRGFKAEFSSENPAMCGGEITSSSGVLKSPDSLNSSSFYCEWEMVKSNANSTMLFSITGNIGVNKPGDCEYTSTKLAFYNEDALIETLCSIYNKPAILLSPFPITVLKGYKSMYFRSIILSLPGVGFGNEISYRIEYKEMPCGGILRGPEHEITNPSVNETDSPVGCVWKVIYPEEQSIQITFVDLDLSLNCDEEHVIIYNGPHPTSPLAIKWCGATLPAPITSQTNNLWIEYRSDAKRRQSKFKIKLDPTSKGCGGVHHGTTGELMSPGFSLKYMPNTECDWDVRAEPGYRIVLKFIDRFYLESSKDCTKDYVKIFIWKNKQWIENSVHCGRNQVNVEIETEATRVRVLFHSDESNEGDGFKLLWTTKCGGTFTEPQGQIMSPNYPRKYVPFLNCVYNIAAPGKIIRGSFTAFDLEDVTECSYDNVTVIDPKTEMSALEPPRAYCGLNAPPPITARDQVTITFRTDWITERSGFLFKYTVDECGGEIVKEAREISTPNHGGVYLDGLTCTWNITAPEDKVVVVSFKSFRLENSAGCRFDSLTAWQVVDGAEYKKGTYCGYDNPGTIISQQNKLNLIFVSDITNGFDGFVASVRYTYGPSRGCGGILFVEDDAKTITAPDIDRNGHYDSFLDCSWHVSTALGYVIQIEFEFLKLDVCEKCSCDYVELKDSMHSNSSVIGRYCDTPQFQKTVTVSNEVWIQFKSDNINNTGTGFRMKLSRKTSECGVSELTVQNETQTLTSPGYPAACKPGLRCMWTLNNPNNRLLKLHYTDVDIEPSERCVGDHLKVIGVEPWISGGFMDFFSPPLYQLSSLETKKQPFFNLCGRKKDVPDTFASSNSLKLAFVCSADRPADAKGSAFKIEYSSSECSRNLTRTEFGRLRHANLVKDCQVVITAPNQNDTVSLYVRQLSFVIRDCTSKVAVYDGTNKDGKLLATLCGDFNTRVLSSTGSALYLHITMAPYDTVYQSYVPSFDFSFTTTNKGRGCGGRMIDFAGAISSPFFGSNVRNNSDCEWDIMIPVPHEKIKLSFMEFNIGTKAFCATDYLEIFDVNADGELQSRAKFCGGDYPGILICSTGHVIVKYVSSVNNAGTGWYMTFNVNNEVN